MLRDITIGQHYPVKSMIHQLDPRTKILTSLMYIIILFMIGPLWGYILATLMLSAIIFISNVPARFILKGLRPIVLFLVFAVSINMFLTPGEIIFQLGFLKVSSLGLNRALITVFRFCLLIISSSMVTLTTSPMALTDGIEKLLDPLKKVKFPSHELAMMMTIALRFIPTLIEEADKIMKAQIARGADFESGNIFNRAKAMVPLLVPLFIGAFRRADDLAMAMEARCYRGGKGRTRMNALSFSKRDFLAFAIVVVYFVLMLVYT